MIVKTVRDESGRHVRTEVTAGPYSVALIAHPSVAVFCSTARPGLSMLELEEYATVGVRELMGTAPVGPRQGVGKGLGGRWDSAEWAWRKVPLEEALAFIGELEVAHSPMYWRLPEWAGPGTLSHVIVRYPNGTVAVINGNRGMPCVPREASYTLDGYKKVAVRLVGLDGEDLMLRTIQELRVPDAGVPWPVYQMTPEELAELLKEVAALAD